MKQHHESPKLAHRFLLVRPPTSLFSVAFCLSSPTLSVGSVSVSLLVLLLSLLLSMQGCGGWSIIIDRIPYSKRKSSPYTNNDEMLANTPSVIQQALTPGECQAYTDHIIQQDEQLAEKWDQLQQAKTQHIATSRDDPIYASFAMSDIYDNESNQFKSSRFKTLKQLMPFIFDKDNFVVDYIAKKYAKSLGEYQVETFGYAGTCQMAFHPHTKVVLCTQGMVGYRLLHDQDLTVLNQDDVIPQFLRHPIEAPTNQQDSFYSTGFLCTNSRVFAAEYDLEQHTKQQQSLLKPRQNALQVVKAMQQSYYLSLPFRSYDDSGIHYSDYELQVDQNNDIVFKQKKNFKKKKQKRKINFVVDNDDDDDYDFDEEEGYIREEDEHDVDDCAAILYPGDILIIPPGHWYQSFGLLGNQACMTVSLPYCYDAYELLRQALMTVPRYFVPNDLIKKLLSFNGVSPTLYKNKIYQDRTVQKCWIDHVFQLIDRYYVAHKEKMMQQNKDSDHDYEIYDDDDDYDYDDEIMDDFDYNRGDELYYKRIVHDTNHVESTTTKTTTTTTTTTTTATTKSQTQHSSPFDNNITSTRFYEGIDPDDIESVFQ